MVCPLKYAKMTQNIMCILTHNNEKTLTYHVLILPQLIHDLTDHLAAPKNETVLPAFMNAEPAITTNMTDLPLS